MNLASSNKNFWQFVCLFTLLVFPIFAGDIRVKGSVSDEDRQDIEEIIGAAEKEYLSKLKLDENYRLDIYGCKDVEEFMGLTGANGWNGGHFLNRVIYLQRVGALKSRGKLEQTLNHEYIHYCIWRMAGNNCPVWLNEGLAMNLTGEIAQMDCIGITIEGTTDKRELERLIRSRDREKAMKGYCQAGMLVKKLIQDEGFEAIRETLRK